MFKALLAALLIAASTAQADQLILGGFSRHANAGYRESNPGLGYVRNGYVVGAYRNSLDKTSVYAGKEWRTESFYGVQAGVLAGAITGYNSSAVPMIVPFVAVPLGPVELNFSAVPKLTKQSSAVAILVFRLNF